jgi:hypothetical protein
MSGRGAVFVALAIVVWPRSSASSGAQIKAGSYVYQGGGGSLVVKTEASGKQSFVIQTVGGNAHTCEVSGEIKGLKGRGGDVSSPCLIRFDAAPNSVTVTPETKDACRGYCGVRAGFDGKYLVPSPECQPKAVKATRTRFKKLYDQKQFSEALSALQPMLRCEDVVDRFERMWIRNDLAVTHHALKDDVACLNVLAPLKDFAASDDPGSAEPSFQEELNRLAKATRSNLATCQRKK